MKPTTLNYLRRLIKSETFVLGVTLIVVGLLLPGADVCAPFGLGLTFVSAVIALFED